MKKLINKFTSRKFLAAVVGIISGLAIVFGVDENAISSVSGAVLAGASLITYIVTEGRIDAQSVAAAIEKLQDASDAILGESDD